MIRKDQYAECLMTIKSLQKELRQCQRDRQREHDLRCKLAGELESITEVLSEIRDCYEEGDTEGIEKRYRRFFSQNVEARHPERRQPLGIAYADLLVPSSRKTSGGVNRRSAVVANELPFSDTYEESKCYAY